MMSRLAAISAAPRKTNAPFHRQTRSTIWPTGIFSAHGIPAQKPSDASSAADSPRCSLTKNVPTTPVSPDTPAATYTINGGK